MNLTAFVDVAIGLSLVFLGASLFVTIINEFIAQTLNRRGAYLLKSLITLFDSESTRELLKRAPLMDKLFDARCQRSYVDTLDMAQALIAGLRPNKPGATTMTELVGAIQKLPDTKLKVALLGIAITAGEDVQAFVKAVSAWIERSLTALGGAYKRHTQWICLILGLVIAIMFNIDTVTLTQRLYSDAGLRNDMVVAATQFVEKTDPATFTKCLGLDPGGAQYAAECASLAALTSALKDRKEVWSRLPIGWSQGNYAHPFFMGLGWLLTALAISLGAPFWFDLLNKLVNIRHSMGKPQPDPEPKPKQAQAGARSRTAWTSSPAGSVPKARPLSPARRDAQKASAIACGAWLTCSDPCIASTRRSARRRARPSASAASAISVSSVATKRSSRASPPRAFSSSARKAYSTSCASKRSDMHRSSCRASGRASG